MTTTSFDIFRMDASGASWLETAASLEEAEARVRKIAENIPGQYLVLNQKTGNKFFITLNGANSDTHGSARSSRTAGA
jgi:hypothetical protein|nr:hypothetical protein [Candidatus Acidoferrales bacterium]